MLSAKEQMAKIIHEQPDDSSYDEILRELAFANGPTRPCRFGCVMMK